MISFLRVVGERYHQPARLFLVGGTSLVYEGYRQRTIDVDLTIEVSPGDFMPLPAGYADRHAFLGRYGQVDVFHFDFYSTALSKIERSQRQVLADVLMLLEKGRIEWDRLEEMHREVLPLMGQKSLRQKPRDFTLNFETIRALWQTAGGQP